MNHKKNLALFLITSFSLMAVALYNWFPLADNDTSAYLEQAIFPHFVPERTPFYGMFIRITCLWTSLWFTVFAQCAILGYLILKYIQRIRNFTQNIPNSGLPDTETIPNYIFSFNLLSVISIISFTCVSWVACCLMPDVFGGILLLAIILFISEQDNKTGSLVIYALIIFIANIIHNSHLPITVLFSSVLLIMAFVKKRKMLINRSLILITLCIVVWGLMCSMNAVKKHGFTFSRGRNIVMVAKFAEDGILNTYLNDNCNKKQLQMCAYKDHIPGNVTEFLTSPEGPLYKMGGWDSSRAEYSTIVHDVFTTPRYLTMYAQKSVIGTLKELTQVEAPDKPAVMGKDTETWKKVKQYFTDELPAYTTSLQNNNTLSAGSCNFVYYLFFILSSLWMLLFYSRVMNKELAFIYCCIIFFLFINAFVIATFATVTYRFQYRVWWILPATNAITIIKYYLGRSGKPATTDNRSI